MAQVPVSRAWFGEALRAARESRLLTRAQLAQKLGVSPSTVANAERGHRTPPYPDLPKWAVALGMMDEGQALQEAYRFSQGFLEEGATGPGSEKPFWDSSAWGEGGSAKINTDLLQSHFTLLDWTDPQYLSDRRVLLRLLCAYNFIRVMERLKPEESCGFGEAGAVDSEPASDPLLHFSIYLAPHGAEQIVVDMPDLDRLAKEAEWTPQVARSRHLKEPVDVPAGLLDGLTEADLKVIKAVADGLRRARQAD
jgi:transcriptional regulator with XRE-family HTH domain